MLAIGPLVVVAELASSWVDRGDPIHLDGVLMEAASRRAGMPSVGRLDSLAELHSPALPIWSLDACGEARWLCSAAEPVAPVAPDTVCQVKRRDMEDWDRLARPVNVAAGPDRDRLERADAMVAAGLRWHTRGNRGLVIDLLRMLWGPASDPFGFVGSKRRAGAGELTGWRVDVGTHAPERCLLRDGCTARHLPAAWVSSAARWRRGASMPPYWHPERRERVPWLGVPVELRPEVHAALTRVGHVD